ncbi:MAG: hypothetical protein NZ895_03255 [Archaeoglobaceae archaeon]|nr:hypothetical protein [Archaeoglobaceae archaeon]MCX8152103.1 hypothetical protein [Archaeoglobaceae archaeon]MDW8013538.1 hypothetical protein [Archaeoglobaceae archaeon]
MKRIELYTYEDATKDMEEGICEEDAIIKKWESIVDALIEIENVALQITPYCEKYFDCEGCPITLFDYDCSHPMSIYNIFCTELKKLRIITESMLTTLYLVKRKIEKDREPFV